MIPVSNNYIFTNIGFLILSFVGVLTIDNFGFPNEVATNWGSTIGGVSSQRQRYGSSGFCAPNTQCLPLASCPFLNNLANHDCIYSSRVGQLGCGYQGSGLVCCPTSTQSTYSTSTNENQCGSSLVQGPNYNGIGAYPWVARVGFRNTDNGELKFACSGSIITKRIILTAAHCALAKSTNYKLHTVRVGEYLTHTNLDCGEEFCGLPTQDIGINHVILHPDYEQQIYKNDVALLVLNSNINYSVTAQPICLPESWSINSNRGILVGWGKTAGQIQATSCQQALSLPLLNLQQCVNVYGNTLPITENHLCAGGEAGNDACSGFGGSPMVQRQGDAYFQIGILSFGSDQCGAPGVPSVYTNVKKYIAWVKENIPKFYNN